MSIRKKTARHLLGSNGGNACRLPAAGTTRATSRACRRRPTGNKNQPDLVYCRDNRLCDRTGRQYDWGGITNRDRIAAGIFGGLLAVCLLSLPADAADGPQKADFTSERWSTEAKHVADWVVHAGDNQEKDGRKLPFVILDKTDARIYLFDAQGKLQAAAAALLGLGVGDTSFAGIGDRKLSSIRPADRTTPAGRFVGFMGHAFVTNPKRAEDVLWVDYPGGVSIHRVVKSANRLKRMDTLTPLDNRVSFGCINVPVKFFENMVRPAFKETKGIIYVLPETRTAREVFASYDVEEHLRLQAAKPMVPVGNRVEEPKQR